MTKAEKYPHSVEAVLQSEAKRLVESVWNMHRCINCDGSIYRVQITPEVWNALNTRQKDYFSHLLGGIWNITMPKDRLGVYLCVQREYVSSFHYHTPLRVHPIRVNK